MKKAILLLTIFLLSLMTVTAQEVFVGDFFNVQDAPQLLAIGGGTSCGYYTNYAGLCKSKNDCSSDCSTCYDVQTVDSSLCGGTSSSSSGDGCNDFDFRCSGSQPQQCVIDSWINVDSDCRYVSNSECVSTSSSASCEPLRECDEFDQRCDGSQPQQCFNGEWIDSDTDCKYLSNPSAQCSLDGGFAVCEEIRDCNENGFQCDGSQPQQCFNGAWMNVDTDCNLVSGTQCVATSSSAGCNDVVSGTSISSPTFFQDSSTSSGTPAPSSRVCIEDTFQCSSTQPQQCINGNWLNVDSDCSLVTGTECVADVVSAGCQDVSVCEESISRCDGSQPQVCFDGGWINSDTNCDVFSNPQAECIEQEFSALCVEVLSIQKCVNSEEYLVQQGEQTAFKKSCPDNSQCDQVSDNVIKCNPKSSLVSNLGEGKSTVSVLGLVVLGLSVLALFILKHPLLIVPIVLSSIWIIIRLVGWV
jgi:hypothetical protein